MKTEYTCHEFVTHRDLDGVESLMNRDELTEMKKKIDDLIVTMHFHSHTEMLLVQDAMKRGYLAAHTTFNKKSGAV